MSNQTLVRQIIGTILLIGLLVGCGAEPAATPMPESPSETSTSKPKPPTSTPKPPTATPTAIPVVATYPLVPRYMLPSAPYIPTEILGATCHYQTDEWNTQSAYIAYACPDLNVTWLSVRFANLEEGQTALDIFGELPSEEASSIPPGELLSEFDNLVIFGRVVTSESGDSNYAYFLMHETESFVISVEEFFPEDTTTAIEDFYLDYGEVVHHAVLEIMLEKVISEGTLPEPTPMVAAQQGLYDQTAPWLVTEAEANEYYRYAADMFGDPFDGTWVWQGDTVDAQWKSVCRKFLDRTNEDAPLVAFGNCVYLRPDYNLDSLQESFQSAVLIKSTFDYPDQSVIYGGKMPNGHTSLNAYILQDDYLFYVWVDSRTLSGRNPENVFQGFNDDFIYKVMMTNLERYELESEDASELSEESDKDDPFIGTWKSVDPGDGSNMQLSISEDNGVYSIDFHDEVAGSCGLDSAGKTIESVGTGTGFVKESVLSTDISLWCMSEPRSFVATLRFDYIYDQTSDTLISGADLENIWNRQ